MDKIREMLVSKDKEMVKLGWITCQERYPAVWAALLNLTKAGTLTKEQLKLVEDNPYVNIGTVVRYRGMEFCPTMVVTNIGASNAGTTGIVVMMVTAKYFNKGNQSFNTVQDRVECFEIIKKKEDES